MHATLHDHPSHETLAAYGAGKLDDALTAEIEAHLEECEWCALVVSELPDNSILQVLREAQAESDKDTAVTEANVQRPTKVPAALQATLPPDGVTDAAKGRSPRGDEVPPELAEHPRYEILERLGEGGMGRVFKARHKIMNRVVALKLVSSKLLSNPQAIERFRREVHAAASLSHPNIVTAHDAEQAGDLHFLAMEFVDGQDLEQLVNERGPLPVETACDYIRQAADGLQQAHEAKMVHRDIKPHNLMVGADGKIKILDFGLASLTAEILDEGLMEDSADDSASQSPRLTVSGTMMGTPDYISPEQGQDATSADIRSDIYGLGCTLYYLLASKPPFDERSVLDKLRAHAGEEAAPLSELRDDVPPEVAEVVRKMMAKRPEDRYQTPAEVAQALETSTPACQSPEVRHHIKTAVTRGFKYRVLPALLVALLLLALLPLTYFYGAVVVRYATNKGVLVVEVDDENVEFVIKDGAGITLRDKSTDRQFTLTPTDGQIEVYDASSNLRLLTKDFTLTRGDKVYVRVTPVELATHRARSENNDAIPGETGVERLPLVHTLQGHTDYLDGGAFSPDGEFVYTAGADGAVRKWDVASGKQIWLREGLGSIHAVAASPNGKFLAAATNGAQQITLLDSESGEVATTMGPKGHKTHSLAFAPDGKFLLSGDYPGATTLWNVETGEVERILTAKGPSIETVAISRDGRIAMAADYEDTIRLWDAHDWKLLREIRGGYRDAALSSDGRFVVCGGGKVFDTQSGKLVKTLAMPKVGSIQLTPDDRHVVFCQGSSQLRVIDFASGQEVASAENATQALNEVAVSPDGRHAVTGGGWKWDGKMVRSGDYRARLWRLPQSLWPQGLADRWKPLFNGRDLSGWQTHPTQPEGWRVEDGLLIGDGGATGHLFTEKGTFDNFHLRAEVKINDHGNGGLYFRSEVDLSDTKKHPSGYEAQILNGTHVNPRGWREPQMTGSLYGLVRVEKQLVPPDEWFTLEVIAVDNHIVIKVNGETTADYVDAKRTYERGYIALQQMPTARGRQATDIRFRKIEIRELDEEGRPIELDADGPQSVSYPRIWEGHSEPITQLTLSPDGRGLLSASKDGTIRVWDVASGRQVAMLEGHTHWVNGAIFSSDAQLILSVGGHRDTTLRIWDAETWEEKRHWKLPEQGFRIAVPRHGMDVAVAGQFGLQVYDLKTGELKQTLEENRPCFSVAYLPRGGIVASVDGRIHLFNERDGKPIWSKEVLIRDSDKEALKPPYVDSVIRFDISPDGRTIAAIGNQGIVYLLSPDNGDILKQWQAHDGLADIQFSPDGKRLFTAGHDKKLRLWNVASGKLLDERAAETYCTNTLAVLPDGERVSTGGGGYRASIPGSTIGATEGKTDGDYALRIWRFADESNASTSSKP